MENLGISMSPPYEEERPATNQEDVPGPGEKQAPATVIDGISQAGEDSHPDHEGGRQEDPHTGQVHDQDEHQEEGPVEQHTEANSNGDEYEQQGVEEVQPLRRSTRERKPATGLIQEYTSTARL